MKKAGIDLGTTFIKTHNGIVFPSGISEQICLSSHVLEVNGKSYAMELFNEKAQYGVNINKTNNKNIRLNYIYALSKLMNSNEQIFENVVCGLPSSQWKNESTVAQFKELLDLRVPETVIVNNEEKTIQVDNISVVPEGSTSYYAINYSNFNGRKVLVLDWGGLTLNQTLFEDDEIVDLHTDEFGILKVYQEMAEKITSETGYNIKLEEMFDILTMGLFIKGKITNVDDIIGKIAIDYCKNIYRNLLLRWSIDTIPYVVMVGAGSITMCKYLKEFVPHAELENNAQSLAAIGMLKIA